MKTNMHPLLVFGGGVVATLIILALLGKFPSNTSVGLGEPEKKTAYTPHSIVGASEITCTYPQIVHANSFGDTITHSIPAAEEEPFIFTFSNLDTEMGEVKSIDATRTISEAPIIKMSETPTKLTYVEGTGDAYITTHTIFKDTGVAIYTKEVDLLGTPAGSLAIGTCVGI